MTEEGMDPRIFPFKDVKTETDPYLDYVGNFDKDDNVIVIDNGKKEEVFFCLLRDKTSICFRILQFTNGLA